ncbi:MAG: DUF1553 domain-containing protein, partial [Verrucomicrobiota bacterium]
WTQKDYRSYANIFGQVKSGTSPEAKKAITAANKRRKGIRVEKKRLPNLKEVYLETRRPQSLKDPKSNQPLPPAALGGPSLESQNDYREAFFEWLVSPDNPFFARSFVNRVWAHYMGPGIVEPVDDFSAANPPSNTELLDAMAEDFVASAFDLRHLERQILNSQAYQLSAIPNESNATDKRNYARKYPRPMMAEVVVDVVNAALDAKDEFPKDAPKGSHAIEVAATRIQDRSLAHAFQVFGRPPRTSVCDCDRSSEPALPQALYLMTDDEVLGKIRNGRLKDLLREGGRDERLKRGEDLSQEEVHEILDDLFLATLTRWPGESERVAAVEHIRGASTLEVGFQDTVWALLNTREFILNH